jgi:hypothetical protein
MDSSSTASSPSISSIELSESEEWKEDVRQMVLLIKKLLPIVCISIGARVGQWCKCFLLTLFCTNPSLTFITMIILHLFFLVMDSIMKTSNLLPY